MATGNAILQAHMLPRVGGEAGCVALGKDRHPSERDTRLPMGVSYIQAAGTGSAGAVLLHLMAGIREYPPSPLFSLLGDILFSPFKERRWPFLFSWAFAEWKIE